MDPRGSPRYLRSPASRGYNSPFTVAEPHPIPPPWIQTRTRSATVSTEEPEIRIPRLPDHSPLSQSLPNNCIGDVQEKGIKKKSSSGIKNVWQMFRSSKSDIKAKKEELSFSMDEDELEPPRFLVRDVKRLQRDESPVKMSQSASFSYSSLSQVCPRSPTGHVPSDVDCFMQCSKDAESGQADTPIRRVSSGRRRAATVPASPPKALAPKTPVRRGTDSATADHRYSFMPNVEDVINVTGAEYQAYDDCEAESKDQDPISPLRGKTVIAPWTRRRSISDASEDVEAVAGSFHRKSPLSQSVSIDRIPEDTEKTPKKKKKSKNKLKNLLTISKSEPKIKKGTPKPDNKKHCANEEAKENCPTAPGFVVNEVKLVQSASFDFSHFPETFNAEVLDNQSYTETSSADMASNETNPTPSRSNTARRRALTLPPPPHKRLAVPTPRRGTDTNEKPDPRFSFLPNTVDVLSFPTERIYNMLDSQSQSNAELNNQDPGADDAEYDSDYTDGEPAHYSESESQSNIGGYNNASGAPVLSNYDGPIQLEASAIAARRRFLEMQIRENQRWCRLLRAQVQAGEVMERIAELVHGVPDQQVDIHELLQAARQMVQVLIDQ